MTYGIQVFGTDGNGDYVVADTDQSFKPLVVANVGIGTSVALPSSGNYLIFVNQKGLYGSVSNGASVQTATRVTIYNNTAYFWYCSSWTSSSTAKGDNLISATWSNTANCRYIILAETAGLNASGNYGVEINDSSGNEIFDSRKISINDSFRLLGSFTYDTPYTDNDNYNSLVISTDEDMFVEMAPFTEVKSSASATPLTFACVGPEFRSTEVRYSFSTGTRQFGKYYGTFTFGELLYNPTNITAGKPTGWTQPY